MDNGKTARCIFLEDVESIQNRAKLKENEPKTNDFWLSAEEREIQSLVRVSVN